MPPVFGKESFVQPFYFLRNYRGDSCGFQNLPFDGKTQEVHRMGKLRQKILLFITLLMAVTLFAAAATASGPFLRMATTTSTDNTGLLDFLAPLFQEDTGIELQWVAVGTGKALEYGKNCDVDILMVHAPDAEKEYVKNGYGVNRREIMFNDFVIIGPESDPAGVRGMDIRNTLQTIMDKEALFASRGDNSGTHKKEISLWTGSGLEVPDKQSWYIQTGQGMINTINIAAERNAYTMTDRGTFIKYEANHDGNPPLVILVEGDDLFRNQYSVMAVNPQRCDNVKYDLALKFIDWIRSDKVQKAIGDFRLLDKQLFTPNAK
jgi:tungstate transport system substrate-binding protein